LSGEPHLLRLANFQVFGTQGQSSRFAATRGEDFRISIDDVQHKLAVLRQHCAEERRDDEAIEKTLLVTCPLLADIDATLAGGGSANSVWSAHSNSGWLAFTTTR
jgi:hypothetical protein